MLLVTSVSALITSVMGFQDFKLQMFVGKGLSFLFEVSAVFLISQN